MTRTHESGFLVRPEASTVNASNAYRERLTPGSSGPLPRLFGLRVRLPGQRDLVIRTGRRAVRDYFGRWEASREMAEARRGAQREEAR
jgi:hypothetical protein